MSWVRSLNRSAGAAGEVQLTYNADSDTLDVITSLSVSPEYRNATQSDALDFLQTAFGFSNPEAANLITRAVNTGYTEAPIVLEKAVSTLASKASLVPEQQRGEVLFALAEDLSDEIIFGIQFDREGLGQYIVSGPPDNYFQYVCMDPHLSRFNRGGLAKVAALTRVFVESYIDNNLAVAGGFLRQGQPDVSRIYSGAISFKDTAENSDQLVGAVTVFMNRRLSDAERALVEAIFSGDQTAVAEALVTISPESAYIASPSPLGIPAMPGTTYEVPTGPAFAAISKRADAIPITIVGQEWGKPPPRQWKEKVAPPPPPDTVLSRVEDLRQEIEVFRQALFHAGHFPSILERLNAQSEQIDSDLEAIDTEIDNVNSELAALSGGAVSAPEGLESWKAPLLELDVYQKGAEQELALDWERLQKDKRRKLAEKQAVFGEALSSFKDLLSVVPDSIVNAVSGAFKINLFEQEPDSIVELNAMGYRIRDEIRDAISKNKRDIASLRKEPLKKRPLWPTEEPAWLRSFKRIISYTPRRAVDSAIVDFNENYGYLPDVPHWEDARNFLSILREQKYVGSRSSGYINWWLESWGETPPEELFAPEEEEPEEEGEVPPEFAFTPWTKK